MFGLPLATIFQGGTMAVAVASLFTALGIWFRYGPERKRATNEEKIIDNADISSRLKEFRLEVHALRNELQAVQMELHNARNQSARRGDKLNMLLFIVRMVMDELSARDPGNQVLAQVKNLLSRVDDEPNRSGSDVLQAAEEAHEATGATVQQVKAEEAKDG